MKRTVTQFDLNRPQLQSGTEARLNPKDINQVKQQLLEELVELEKQRNMLDSDAKSIDFSMTQIYEEMIQSRRVYFNRLTR